MFKPGVLSNREAEELNQLARDVSSLKNTRAQEGSGITIDRPVSSNMVIGFDKSVITSSGPQNVVQITSATLTTPGIPDIPYFTGVEKNLVGGAWTTGSAVRVISTSNDDKPGFVTPIGGEIYPATYIGFASDGVTKCYAIRPMPGRSALVGFYGGVATLISPAGELPYYEGVATIVYDSLGHSPGYAPTIHPTYVRIYNIGTSAPNPAKSYIGTYMGLSIDGVSRYYFIRSDKTTVVTGVTASCFAGAFTMSVTTADIEAPLW